MVVTSHLLPHHVTSSNPGQISTVIMDMTPDRVAPDGIVTLADSARDNPWCVTFT